MKMEYDHKKLEEGLHELMKLNTDQLGEAIGKTLQTKNVYKAVKSYLDAEKLASPIIDTSDYRSKCGVAIFQRFENPTLYPGHPYLNRKISDLNLTVRVEKCLDSIGLSLDSEISELIRKSGDDLLSISKFGKTCLREVKRKLNDVDLYLRGDPQE